MSKFPDEMIEAFTATTNLAATGMARINTEILDFGKSRLETDASAAEALLAAKSVTDMVALQHDFMISAMEAYAEEAGKLRDMTVALTNEMMGQIHLPVEI